MSRSGRARPWRLRCRRDRRACGPRLLDREGQLRDFGLTAQPCEFRPQFQIGGQEALVLAREQVRDLTERLDIAFLVQRHHAGAQ